MFKKYDLEYTIVAKSKLFDKKWYLKTYSDVARAKMNPIKHYIKHGWHEGRNPGPTFNTNEYLANNPDVANAHMNPLVHWERYGKNENRMPLPGTVTSKRLSAKAKTADIVEFPNDAKKYTYISSNIKNHYQRIAVFASFSSDGTIPDYVIYYLKELKKVCDGIVFVADNPLKKSEFEKVKKLVMYARCERHNEYDFGSYKRGYMWLKKQGLLKRCDELLLCNDSCYGPVYPLREVFDTMGKKDCDFWGLLSNTQHRYHLQSYFLNFKANVFKSDAFDKFMQSIEAQDSVQQVILKYEVQLTYILTNAGYKSCAFIDCEKHADLYSINPNLTLFPDWLITHRFPLIKVKSIRQSRVHNMEAPDDILLHTKKINKKLFSLIQAHKNTEPLNVIQEHNQ